jgi:hypothetical protein
MRLSPQNTCCSLSWSYPVWLQCWCAVDLTPLLLYLVSSATLPLSSPQAVLTAAAFARQAGALAAADKFKAESAQVPVCLVAVGCVTDVKASFMPLPIGVFRVGWAQATPCILRSTLPIPDMLLTLPVGHLHFHKHQRLTLSENSGAIVFCTLCDRTCTSAL